MIDQEYLQSFFARELGQIWTAIEAGDFSITIPDPADVDLPLGALASLVARSSNNFGQAARFAGFARAQAKLAKGRFERKWKRARTGRNDAERDAFAMDSCMAEHTELSTAEALAEVAEALEAAARIASESARKLHTAAENQLTAERREARGSFAEADYHS